MPSSFSANLGLEKPANGEQNNAWGDTVNADTDKIDTAFGRLGYAAPVTISSLVTVQAVAIPSGLLRHQCEFSLTPYTTARVFAQFSFDGGATYSGGAGDYINLVASDLSSGSRTIAPMTGGYLALTEDGMSTTADVFGVLDFTSDGNHWWKSDATGLLQSGVALRTQSSGRSTVSGTATHIRFGVVGTGIASGRLRLRSTP